jgi:hypothetical protein
MGTWRLGSESKPPGNSLFCATLRSHCSAYPTSYPTPFGVENRPRKVTSPYLKFDQNLPSPFSSKWGNFWITRALPGTKVNIANDH